MGSPSVLPGSGVEAVADDPVTDDALLALVRLHGSAAAFATLVRRHEAMVLATCRRVLGSPADADDAFQATFLVLHRRCADAPAGHLAAWLHGISLRCARRLIRARRRRERREREAAQTSTVAPEGERDQAAARALLDEGLARLPPALRQAVILCHLEGHTQRAAAAIAGCPIGTMGRRASEGIQRLRTLLAHRGVEGHAVLAVLAAEATRTTAGALSTVQLLQASSAVAKSTAAVVGAPKLPLGTVLLALACAVAFAAVPVTLHEAHGPRPATPPVATARILPPPSPAPEPPLPTRTAPATRAALPDAPAAAGPTVAQVPSTPPQAPAAPTPVPPVPARPAGPPTRPVPPVAVMTAPPSPPPAPTMPRLSWWWGDQFAGAVPDPRRWLVHDPHPGERVTTGRGLRVFGGGESSVLGSTGLESKAVLPRDHLALTLTVRPEHRTHGLALGFGPWPSAGHGEFYAVFFVSADLYYLVHIRADPIGNTPYIELVELGPYRPGHPYRLRLILQPVGADLYVDAGQGFPLHPSGRLHHGSFDGRVFINNEQQTMWITNLSVDHVRP